MLSCLKCRFAETFCFIKTLDWPFFSEIYELRPAYYFIVQFGGLEIILKAL